MALITVSGYPCSGKTSRSIQIKAFLDSQLTTFNVIILSDDELNIPRNVYDGGYQRPC
jgi:protein KTI12